MPVAIASLSSAQSSRYIFSILTPLALCAAWWLLRVMPRAAAFITRWFTPALAAAAALVFWVQPTLLTRDQNQIFKSQAERLKRDIPVGSTVGYLGTRYWLIANPLLYYTDRTLTQLATAAELCDDSRKIVTVFVDKDQRAIGESAGADVRVDAFDDDRRRRLDAAQTEVTKLSG